MKEEAMAGPWEIDLETRIPFGRGLAGQVAARGPMTFGDIPAEHEVFRPRVRDRVASLLAVPVMSEGKVMGVLEVDTLEPREFTGRDRLVLQVVADRVAPAIARARLLRELRRAQGRLQGLSRRLLRLQERERGRLARELHDEVGQELTALRLGLESNREVLTEAGRSEGYRQMVDLVARLQSQIRSLSRGLRPPALDTLGLEAALVELFEQLTRSTGLEIDYRLLGEPASLTPSARICAYRIVQEALTNVVRHAEVGRAEVEVSLREEIFEVRVRDRGKGFDPSARTSHGSGGLAGMRERAELEGGDLRVESRRGEGTTVVARLPLERDGEPGE